MEINEKCYPVYRDAQQLDRCWKDAAQRMGIDPTQIESCAYGAEGLALLKADEEAAGKYGVTGSPTLIINGQRYVGARSAETFKQAICSGFVTPPTECETQLGTEAAAVEGGC
jgi:predicted DsbA family dithiol-disulfide isomerase